MRPVHLEVCWSGAIEDSPNARSIGGDEKQSFKAFFNAPAELIMVSPVQGASKGGSTFMATESLKAALSNIEDESVTPLLTSFQNLNVLEKILEALVKSEPASQSCSNVRLCSVQGAGQRKVKKI